MLDAVSAPTEVYRPQTDADWLPLALAALDQGGVSASDQARVRQIVEPYMREGATRFSVVRFTVLHSSHQDVGATFDSLIDAERYVPSSPQPQPDVILASDGRAWLRMRFHRGVPPQHSVWYMVEPSSLPHRFLHVQGRAIVSQFVAEHG